MTQGLLVRLEARHGRDHDLESFLEGALPSLRAQPAGMACLAVRFGRSEYGIFDFADEAGREAQLPGAQLLASAPRGEKMAILASKLPPVASGAGLTRGLLLRFPAKPGQAAQLEKFLRDAQAWVAEEPDTMAWFALRFAGGDHGLLSAFADDGARFAHLTGAVLRELTGQALALLDSVPDMDLLQVLATRFDPPADPRA